MKKINDFDADSTWRLLLLQNTEDHKGNGCKLSLFCVLAGLRDNNFDMSSTSTVPHISSQELVSAKKSTFTLPPTMLSIETFFLKLSFQLQIQISYVKTIIIPSNSLLFLCLFILSCKRYLVNTYPIFCTVMGLRMTTMDNTDIFP